MTIRRMALQAAVANLTENQAVTADASGLLKSAGLLTYAYIQNVSATDKLLGRATAGAGSIEEIACTSAGRAILDDVDAAAQRTTLGLGTISTQAANNVSISGGAISGITDLAVADGGTGSSTAAAARVALGLVDANDRMPAAMVPSKILYQYWHASFDEKTVVAGTWGTAADAGQTDFDPSIIASAGTGLTSGATNNNDEIHFGNLTLTPGTYKVTLAYLKSTDTAIVEVLHGTTSIGTQDQYGAITRNQVVSWTYSPTTTVSGNLRFRANGKNASSSSYRCYISRLEIIRTG